MSKSSSPTKSKAEQHRKFLDAARELGCSEDEGAFDKALKKIASEKPPVSVQKRKSAASKRTKK